MLVEQVEREDLQLAITRLALLQHHRGGTVERRFADERAGVVGDATHHVEPAGRATDPHWTSEVKRTFGARSGQLRARARQERGHRVKAEEFAGRVHRVVALAGVSSAMAPRWADTATRLRRHATLRRSRGRRSVRRRSIENPLSGRTYDSPVCGDTRAENYKCG